MQEIRQSALMLWLKGVRLPLTAVESVAKRGQDTASWPPSIAFEKVEASVKEVVGRITGDDQLLGMARLQRAEVAKRQEALFKKGEAERLRQDARQRAEAEKARVEDRREAAEERAEEREERLAEERRAAERQTAEKAASKKAAARKAAAARQAATDRKAKQAEQRRLREEAQALAAREQAVEATGDVLELDAAVRAKKAARRAG